MSYSCMKHGWAHMQSPCPQCHPAKVYSSNTSGMPFVDERSKQTIDRLSLQLACAMEALEIYENGMAYDSDGNIIKIGNTAREALAKIKQLGGENE